MATATASRRRATVIPVAVCLIGALVLGGLTSFGQTVLPDALRFFANSAGGWTMLAFLLVWLSRARPVLGAILGIVAFEALNEGYGIVSGWRGFFYAHPFSTIWSLVGLVAGPVLGLAASLRRYGDGWWRLLAVTQLSAVLLGEGVTSLQTVAESTGPVYWTLEIVLAVVFTAIALVRSEEPANRRLVAVGVWLLGSAAYAALARIFIG